MLVFILMIVLILMMPRVTTYKSTILSRLKYKLTSNSSMWVLLWMCCLHVCVPSKLELQCSLLMNKACAGQWKHIPLIPTPRRQRKNDLCEFQSSQSYTVRPTMSQRKINKNNKDMFLLLVTGISKIHHRSLPHYTPSLYNLRWFPVSKPSKFG